MWRLLNKKKTHIFRHFEKHLTQISANSSQQKKKKNKKAAIELLLSV
jgi:hypothetical protein